jgi:hypothetical protein
VVLLTGCTQTTIASIPTHIHEGRVAVPPKLEVLLGDITEYLLGA